MRQEINLYQDVLLDKPAPLQSRKAALLLAVTVLCLACVGGYSYWKLQSAQQRLAELSAREQSLQATVEQLEKTYPELRPDPALQERLAQLERDVTGKQRALAYFSKQNPQNNRQILDSLEGLAEFSLADVWLRRVRLYDEGHEVQLSGSAVKPEKIPEYLQLLGHQGVFGGQVFARLKLERLEKQGGQVDFDLESSGERTR